MRHSPLTYGLAVLLFVIGIAVFLSPTLMAQSTATTVENYTPIPENVRSDGIPILPPGANWQPVFKAMNDNDRGDGAIGYSKTGELFAVLHFVDAIQLFEPAHVYRLDSDEEWTEMDCSSTPLNTTANIGKFTDSATTLDQFLDDQCPEDTYFGYEYDEDTIKFADLGDNQTIQNSVIKLRDTVASLPGVVYVTPKNPITALVEDEKDLAPTSMEINSQRIQVEDLTFTKILTFVNGKLFDTGNPPNDELTNTSTIAEIDSENAHYIIIQDKATNKDQYMIEIFRLSKMSLKGIDYVKVGMRVFVNTSSGMANVWTNGTHTNAFTVVNSNISAIPDNYSTTSPFLLNAGDATTVEDTIVFPNNTYGDLTVTLHAKLKNDIPVIRAELSLNAIKSPNPVLRFKLDKKTEDLILSKDEFKNKGGVEYIYTSGLVSVKFENFRDGTTLSTTTAKEGTVPETYFRTLSGVDIKEGRYTVTVHVKGYADVFRNDYMIIQSDLSPSNAGSITKDHIKELTINQFSLVKDECNQCETLQACMVCMDNRLVQEYS